MLNELAYKINDTAQVHGWWDKERSFGDIVFSGMINRNTAVFPLLYKP